ncbi:hypothetical protein K504DRAFT_439878 [Pleomassaria siparia CBS 279.74]|uniref:Cell surface protein n=1 Tax=Pleomassaria siparia CBS 279.74 TaxID=1314801 RepID=A0A6G1JZA5_9PLEO|nr:hypothetical protein K504DRAFT_439878 [Pleomassaria siparia CBS 279.74]
MHIHTTPLGLLATLVLALTPLITAHGKVAAVTGDAGGNGTALGIIGGIVPGAGSNDVTEIDTTVFKKRNVETDGLGRTVNGGGNQAAHLHIAMAQSGDTLPQVSEEGGFISGDFHIVTTVTFSKGIKANVSQNIPGKKGNIAANGNVARALQHLHLLKRAANVDKTFPFNVTVPAGTTCTGTVAGLQNVCFMKIANANKAGPFGGVVAFQMAASSSAVANVTAAAAAAVVTRARRASVLVDVNAAIGATMARKFVA